MTTNSINNLPLPPALALLMSSGRWTAPDDDIIERVFGERPSQTHFYSLEDMELENNAWREESLPEYLGTADPKFPPGDIDPHSSILIGDLGHDLPFALDYRVDRTKPRVLFLGTKVDGRWVTVAESIEELVTRLGIS